jgi:hypothetical protein
MDLRWRGMEFVAGRGAWRLLLALKRPQMEQTPRLLLGFSFSAPPPFSFEASAFYHLGEKPKLRDGGDDGGTPRTAGRARLAGTGSDEGRLVKVRDGWLPGTREIEPGAIFHLNHSN